MAKKRKAAKRTFDARRDVLDFRDRMYRTPLVEVPTRVDLEDYKKVGGTGSRRGSGRCLHRLWSCDRRQLPASQRKVIPEPPSAQ